MKLTCERVGRFRSVFLFYTIMNEEIWKDVVGYEGLYEVSSLGNVKRTNPRKNKIGENLKAAINIHGYCMVALSKYNVSKHYQLHRLVAISFIENLNGKPYVNHINGVKTDNRIENLEWVTAKENLQHAMKIGLVSLHNPRPYRKKIANETALIIKNEYQNSKTSHRKLAKKYGISANIIWRITTDSYL